MIFTFDAITLNFPNERNAINTNTLVTHEAVTFVHDSYLYISLLNKSLGTENNELIPKAGIRRIRVIKRNTPRL